MTIDVRSDVDNFAFISTGNPEKDAERAREIRRHNHLEAEGMCPNGCAPVVWDDQHASRCPKCGFVHMNSRPNGGRESGK